MSAQRHFIALSSTLSRDTTGFCLTPSIPYAWQPLGSVIEVPTSPHNQRINVLGFLPCHNALVPYVIEGRVDTAVVIACFEQFSQQWEKRAYVFLDNASVQKQYLRQNGCEARQLNSV